MGRHLFNLPQVSAVVCFKCRRDMEKFEKLTTSLDEFKKLGMVTHHGRSFIVASYSTNVKLMDDIDFEFNANKLYTNVFLHDCIFSIFGQTIISK